MPNIILTRAALAALASQTSPGKTFKSQARKMGPDEFSVPVSDEVFDKAHLGQRRGGPLDLRLCVLRIAGRLS